jgi:hypothetical protein
MRYLEGVGTVGGKIPSGLDYGSGPVDTLAQLLREQNNRMSSYDPYFSRDDSALRQKYDFLCCHEVMEHFYYPSQALKQIDTLVKAGGLIAFRTGILRDDIDFETWWYARDLTHCSFYREQSMEWIAETMSWRQEFASSNSGIYIFRNN